MYLTMNNLYLAALSLNAFTLLVVIALVLAAIAAFSPYPAAPAPRNRLLPVAVILLAKALIVQGL